MAEAVESKPRWYIPTPGELVALLLATELLFLLADRLSLFGLTRGSGWNVLAAVAAFLLVLLVLLVWFGIALLLRRRSRSNFQFTVITLFLLMGCVAVVGGWFGWKLRKTRSQEALMEKIGATDVAYDFEYCHGVKLDPEFPPGPASARRLLGDYFFADITAVELHGKLDEETLASLKAMPRLECLVLWNVRTTKSELEPVQQLHSLRLLYLPGYCSSMIDDDFTRSLPKRQIRYFGGSFPGTISIGKGDPVPAPFTGIRSWRLKEDWGFLIPEGDWEKPLE